MQLQVPTLTCSVFLQVVLVSVGFIVSSSVTGLHIVVKAVNHGTIFISSEH